MAENVQMLYLLLNELGDVNKTFHKIARRSFEANITRAVLAGRRDDWAIYTWRSEKEWADFTVVAIYASISEGAITKGKTVALMYLIEDALCTCCEHDFEDALD